MSRINRAGRTGAVLTVGLLAAGLGLASAPGIAHAATETEVLPFSAYSYGVATDAAGDLFFSNPDTNQIQEWPAGATSSSQLVTLPFTGLVQAIQTSPC